MTMAAAKIQPQTEAEQDAGGDDTERHELAADQEKPGAEREVAPGFLMAVSVSAADSRRPVMIPAAGMTSGEL